MGTGYMAIAIGVWFKPAMLKRSKGTAQALTIIKKPGLTPQVGQAVRGGCAGQVNPVPGAPGYPGQCRRPYTTLRNRNPLSRVDSSATTIRKGH